MTSSILTMLACPYLSLSAILVNRANDANVEGMTDKSKETEGSRLGNIVWRTIFIVFVVVVVGISLLASYLSWSTNSVLGYNILLKVLFAAAAFLAAPQYLLNHIVHKMDAFRFIERHVPPAISQSAVTEVADEPPQEARQGIF